MKLRMKVTQLDVLPTVHNKMADGRSCVELATVATQLLWRAITQLQTEEDRPSSSFREVPVEFQ